MARRSGSTGERTARDMRRAALRLFAEHGYAAVSMRQVAAAVGVQVGALYLYTPDKQSLLADLMIAHLEARLAAWQREAGDEAAPAAVRLERFVRFHIRHQLAHVDEVFVAQMELRNLTPENLTRVERLRRLYEAILETILQDGAQAGSFRPADPRLVAPALIAMLGGLPGWYRRGGRLAAREIEDTYVALAAGAVGVPAPPPRPA